MSLPSLKDTDDVAELQDENAPDEQADEPYPDGTDIAELGSDYKWFLIGREFALTVPGPDSLQFLTQYDGQNVRQRILPAVVNLVVVLNDYMVRYPTVVGGDGMFFVSRVGIHPQDYVREVRFEAGPPIFFVSCHRSQEDKEQWLAADLYSKIELSSFYGVHPTLQHFSGALPIWFASEHAFRKAMDRNARRWISQWTIPDDGTRKAREKIAGLFVDVFEHDGNTGLLCVDAEEASKRATSYDRWGTGGLGRRKRGIVYGQHEQWVAASMADSGDPVLSMLRKVQEAASFVGKDGTTHCMPYRDARLWSCKAPLKGWAARQKGKRVEWTDVEEATLRDNWTIVDRHEMDRLIPRHEIWNIVRKGVAMGLLAADFGSRAINAQR